MNLRIRFWGRKKVQEFEITLETAPGKTELVLIPEQTKLEQIAKQYQKN